MITKVKTPFIAHVRGNHFLVVEKVIGDQVRILDYGRAPHMLYYMQASGEGEDLVPLSASST